jgi:hypothetical protein
MMGIQKSKIYISEMILDRYEYAPAALHDFTKLTVARFVGTGGGFLIKYSNGRTKYIAQSRSSAIIFNKTLLI